MLQPWLAWWLCVTGTITKPDFSRKIPLTVTRLALYLQYCLYITELKTANLIILTFCVSEVGTPAFFALLRDYYIE